MSASDYPTALATDVLIVGAGPAGSAAACALAQRGVDTLMIDMANFPRDKTCGDGLTPRAMAQLQKLGLADDIWKVQRSQGLKLHGFGGSVTVPWSGGVIGPGRHNDFPAFGSAMPRMELDDRIRQLAVERGARFIPRLKATDVDTDDRGRVVSLTAVPTGEKGAKPRTIRCRALILAEGVRSHIGSQLGLRWHKDTVYGIAARAYATTPRHNDPWIHSHLELRDHNNVIQPGYGWIFPLGNGSVNIGCGALSTTSRPAGINTKKLLSTYGEACRSQWDLGELTSFSSALLPMGGAVSHVAGPNWAAIGDSAACVNPLNGEGIDYGLETGATIAELLADSDLDAVDLSAVWPQHLRDTYGASFALARRLGALLTYPSTLPVVGPLGLRGPQSTMLMSAAARMMGNLITAEDADLVARLWKGSGVIARSLTTRFDSTPLWGD